MKLIMAVSADGFVSRCPDDDMSWTGMFDKGVFRMLTSVGGDIACGSKSWKLMPKVLPGRRLKCISNDPFKGIKLHEFNSGTQGQGWLIGGQTVALSALNIGCYIHQAYICRSARKCFPVQGGEAYRLDKHLNESSSNYPTKWRRDMCIAHGDTVVEVWNHA